MEVEVPKDAIILAREEEEKQAYKYGVVELFYSEAEEATWEQLKAAYEGAEE